MADHSPLLLAVDIGNHQIKLGRFTGEADRGLPQPARVWKLATGEADFDALSAMLPGDELAWCVATVQRRAERSLAAWVQDRRPQDRYRLLGNEDLPLEIHVEHPQHVGADRLLAAVAVNQLRTANRPAIVIDAGTAITVDLVSADGAFEGGVILPGFRLTAQALAEGTDLLPHVNHDPAADPPPVVGKSTAAAIRSGLFWGQVGAVRELTCRISGELASSPQLFVAGGDAERLAVFLPEARVVPELVLAGIALCARGGGLRSGDSR